MSCATNKAKNVKIYTDGSCVGNPGAGGYCGILVYKGVEKIIKGAHPLTTNNRMELLAVIESLKILKEPCNIELFSDSKYVCEAINKWLANWIKKDFDKVKNVELWQEYLLVAKPHNIRAFWVKGHNGDMMNEKCDKIAREQANSFILKA